MQFFTLRFAWGALLCCAAFGLSAANITWIGSNNPAQPSTWENPANWSTGTIPSANDDVTLPNTFSWNISINSAAQVRNLNWQRGYLSGTGSLTVNGVLNWAADLEVSYEGITLIVGPNGSFLAETAPVYFEGYGANGPFIVNGTMTLKAGGFGVYGGQFRVNGTLNWVYGNIYQSFEISNTGTLNIGGDLAGYQRLVDDTLYNNGTVVWNSGELRTAGGAILNNGTFNVLASDNVVTGGFPALGSEKFINNGTLTVSSAVPVINMNVLFENNGTVNTSGNTDFQLSNGLVQNGTFDGAGTAILSVVGQGTHLFSGTSLTRNLQSFRLDYPYQVTTVAAGAQFQQIGLFNLRDGYFVCNQALPSTSNYRIGTFPAEAGYFCNWEQNANMSISGALQMGLGQWSGSGKVTLTAANAVWQGTGVGLHLEVATGAVLTVGATGQAYNGHGYLGNNTGGVARLTNRGLVKIVGSGELSSNETAIWENIGTLQVLADSVQVGAYTWNDNFDSGRFVNTGTVTVAATAQAFTIGLPLVNQGAITLPGATNLYSGALRQQGSIVSSGGGTLSVFGVLAELKNNSLTKGFSTLNLTASSNGVIEANADLGTSTSNFRILYSNDFDLLRPMPSDANYWFESSFINLAQPLSPLGTVVTRYGNISGAGSLTINNSLEWLNGVLDVPVTIAGSAVATIQTDSIAIHYSPSPTVGAPLVNNGLTRWLGGAIVVDNQVVTNGVSGTWEVESPSNVQMDGSTQFLNNGTFRNCSSTPVTVIFDLPVVNNGTLNGTGAYTFASTFSNNGTVNPGCSPGRLVVNGNFSAGQAINLEVNGGAVGQHDHLQVNGNMVAGGTLNLLIPPGTTFNGNLMLIESTGSMTGAFSQINVPGGYGVTVQGNKVMLTSTALPVELSAFSARPRNKVVDLQWVTTQERNNERFDIEHSTDGRTFVGIGEVAGAGNSSSPRTYQWTHRTPASGDNYYRLRQVDTDGAFTFSAVQVANLESGQLSLYPTLAQDAVQVLLPVSDNDWQISVLDASGRVWRSTTSAGGETVLTTNDLPAGTYLLQASNERTVLTTRLVKQ